MRVVGYVRESPGPDDGETVFMQSERVRRWVDLNRYDLVAMCQDPRNPEPPTVRSGYQALLGILAAERADLVVVPNLEALSADKIDQEIMIDDLRSREVAVASVEDQDVALLSDPSPDPARRFIRDVLRKYSRYLSRFGTAPDTESVAQPTVTVELIKPTTQSDREGRPHRLRQGVLEADFDNTRTGP